MEREMPVNPDTGGLEPRLLKLSSEAREVLIEFADELICSDPDLMMVDAIMGNLYWTVFAKLSSPQQKKLRSYQRAWIKNRNRTCEPKIKNVLEYSKTREAVHCMSVSIQKRMRDLSKIQKMQN